MDLVADIQCCMNANNIHIPKEIAFLSLNNDYMGHWIVSPPYPGKKLPLSVKSTNKWLSRNKHGLEWEDGYITKPALTTHLRVISKNFEKIYVRGKEKKNVLENIVFNNIINVEEEEEGEKKHPSFNDLAWSNTFCIFHATKKNSVLYSCALNRATRLKNWIKTFRQKSFTNLSDEQFGDFESIIADTTSFGRCVPC